MNLIKLEYKNYNNSNLKTAIDRTGRLRFNSSTINGLNIDENKFLNLSKGEGNEELYLEVVENFDKYSIPIIKGSPYYHAQTGHIFTELGFQFKDNNIIFDITPVDIDGNPYYKLTKWEIPRKSQTGGGR